MTIGSFVCMQCAGFLREFGHRIKSVTASTFTPEEVSDLTIKGNDYAAKTWLAVWIESDDPKPKRENPKKIKEFMKKKYELKSFYWDASTSRAKEPLDLPSMIDWNSFPDAEKKKSEEIVFSPPLPKNGLFESLSTRPVDDIKVAKVAEKSNIDTSWADFASAFPGSNTSTKKVEQAPLAQENTEIVFISNHINNTIQRDIQLDPFESVKSVDNAGKYDALKDLAGLSLSESETKLSNAPRKFTNKSLDLSKFVEVSGGSKSKYPWENPSDLIPKDEKSSLPAFEMNPFAFDNTCAIKVENSDNDCAPTTNVSTSESSLDASRRNEWHTPHDNGSDYKTKEEGIFLQSNWDPNPIDSTAQNVSSGHIYESEWNQSNTELISGKDTQSHVDLQTQCIGEVSSSYHCKESSSTTLVEGDLTISYQSTESEKYHLQTLHSTQAYVPYELDSNVWG